MSDGAEIVARLRRGSATAYVVVLGVTIPSATLAFYLWGTDTWLKGQSPAIIITLAGTAFALALWAIAPREHRPSRLFVAFGLAYIGAWLTITLMARAEGGGENHTAWLAPLIVAALVVKPPGWKSARAGGDVFALGLVAIAIVSHVLHVTGVFLFPHYWYPSRGLELLLSPDVLDKIGLLYRWEGPFGSVSDAAPVGLYLVLYGLLRQGWIRWVCSVVGLLILGVAASWSAFFGLAAAAVTLLWFTSSVRGRAVPILAKAMVTAAVVLLGAGYVAVADPTFNGRVPIWSAYLAEWTGAPLLGIGGSGIGARLDVLLNGHGHNYYVDTLLRYGLLGFVITVVTLVLAGSLAFVAGHRGAAPLAALAVGFGVVLVGESLLLWRYVVYVQFEIIMVAVLAQAWIARTLLPTRHESRSTATP